MAKNEQPRGSLGGRSRKAADGTEETAEMSIVQQWEVRRQELVAQGDIFDFYGNVTRSGRRILLGAGWDGEQIEQMERMQKNAVAPVETVLSPREKFAAQADKDRVRREEEESALQHMRRRIGREAYDRTMREQGGSTDIAKKAQEEAELAFDLKMQLKRNRRTTS